MRGKFEASASDRGNEFVTVLSRAWLAGGKDIVMSGLVPAISLRNALCLSKRDARDRPGHDNNEGCGVWVPAFAGTTDERGRDDNKTRFTMRAKGLIQMRANAAEARLICIARSFV